MGQEKVLRSFLDEMVVLQGGKTDDIWCTSHPLLLPFMDKKKGFIKLFLEYKKRDRCNTSISCSFVEFNTL